MNEKLKNPVLYLIPGSLGSEQPAMSVSPEVRQVIKQLKNFIVEDLRSARRFIRSVDKEINIDALDFSLLNEHTEDMEVAGLLKPLQEGHDTGLLSEAGLPCVADPGSNLVTLAHQAGFTVKPLPGPSSIYLALMASGFNGQNYVFHGYLPIDKHERAQKIREMKNDRTQIFIEAPYRNNQLLQSLVRTCNGSTLLCIASGLTTEKERIIVKPVGQWKDNAPDLNKIPAVFLLYH